MDEALNCNSTGYGGIGGGYRSAKVRICGRNEEVGFHFEPLAPIRLEYIHSVVSCVLRQSNKKLLASLGTVFKSKFNLRIPVLLKISYLSSVLLKAHWIESRYSTIRQRRPDPL